MTPHSPIKVVQIVRAPLGGIRKHIAAIAETLEDSPDFEWLWITSTEDGDADEGFLNFLKQNPQYEKKVIALKINDRPEFRDIANILKLRSLLKNQGISVLHGHGAKGGLYARVVAPMIGAQSIYTPHGGSLHDMFGKLKGLFYSLIEKVLAPLTHLFVFESRYTQEQFEKKVSPHYKNTLLIRNGIMPPPQQPVTRRQGAPWILGAFGALRFIKGHDLVIQALPLLNERNIPCHFHIYGEGEEKKNLESLAQGLGVADQVKIFAKTQDVYGAIATSDIVLQPSRHESFGYVPLEAMAVGRPVVASSKGGLVEVVENQKTGILVDELTPQAFALAIEQLIQDEKLRERLVQAGRQAVESEFSEKDQMENLKKAYKKLSQ